VAVIAFAVSYLINSMHDYNAYRGQWWAAVSGYGPWATEAEGQVIDTNAYGPFHAVFAPLWAIYWLLPKFIFTGLSIGIFAILVNASRSAGIALTRARLWLLAVLFPLSPLTIITVYFFGINDIVPAFCMVVACAVFAGGQRGWAGFWIALGALMKFYPLLFAGFLAGRGDGRLDLRVPLVGLVVFLAGMAAAYLVWGPAVLSPFQFGSDRGPKMLSILRYLDSVETLHQSAILQHLVARNALYVIGAAVLVALHGWLARLEWELTLLVGIFAVFFVYKVGHPQFYLSWFAVQAWIIAGRSDGPAFRVAWAFLPAAIFVSAFQCLYLSTDLLTDSYLQDDWFFVRDYVSPFFLATVLWCVYRSRRDLFRRWHWPAGIRV
ncbi:MAG: DUF2029 domain-containing protein, partial [Rhodobacter sp.]|nr:DUF2029 domain-containing protein [Rhodobacter sp.]